MLLLAGFGYPLLLIALACATRLSHLAILLFLTGCIANLSNTAANTQAVQIEHYYRRSIITLFHGMWSCAGLVAVSLALAFALGQASIFLHFVCVSCTACLLLSFSGGALLPHDRRPSHAPETKTLRAWIPSPLILWIGLAALGCMVCEGVVYNWSGVYLRNVLEATGKQKSYGYFAYMCTMVPMRFVADRIINRLGQQRMLTLSALALLIGLILIVGAPSLPAPYALIATLPGFAILGLGTSAIVPICCSLAGKTTDRPPSIAIAEVSMIGFLGFLAMPPILGAISHATNLRIAFASTLLMALLILAATRAIYRKTHR